MERTATTSASTTTKTIFVTGATGFQSGAFIKYFFDSPLQGIKIRGLTRNANSEAAKKLKALDKTNGEILELVEGDLTNADQMRRLMRGCTSLLLNLEPGALAKGAGYPQDDLVRGCEIEKNTGIMLINIAKELGMEQVVYLSIFGLEQPTDVPHNQSKYYIQEHLKQNASAFKYFTILRPLSFMENIIRQPYMVEGLRANVLNYPLPADTNLGLISIDDIGQVCYKVFMNPKHYNGRVLDLLGGVYRVGDIPRILGLSGLGNYPLEKLHYDYQKYYKFLIDVGPQHTPEQVKQCCAPDVLAEPTSLEQWANKHKQDIAALKSGREPRITYF